MLSVIRCRELLGFESRNLADDEIAALCEQLYCLAHSMVAEFDNTMNRKTSNPNVLNFRMALDSFMEAERVAIEERAAIIEFDGKLPRDKAERAAIMLSLESKEN